MGTMLDYRMCRYPAELHSFIVLCGRERKRIRGTMTKSICGNRVNLYRLASGLSRVGYRVIGIRFSPVGCHVMFESDGRASNEATAR
jgi:hypothetical protein